MKKIDLKPYHAQLASYRADRLTAAFPHYEREVRSSSFTHDRATPSAAAHFQKQMRLLGVCSLCGTMPSRTCGRGEQWLSSNGPFYATLGILRHPWHFSCALIIVEWCRRDSNKARRGHPANSIIPSSSSS